MPIVPFDDLAGYVAELRRSRPIIVLTNGHFDLLHTGHLRYLKAAREVGDALIVGLNDDAMTTERKGPGRPVFPQDERAELLDGLTCVDAVTIFKEPTAEQLARIVRPDIYVKGGDYGPGGADLPEAPVVRELGGRVEILPLTPGRSTSEIIEAIRAGRGVR